MKNKYKILINFIIFTIFIFIIYDKNEILANNNIFSQNDFNNILEIKRPSHKNAYDNSEYENKYEYFLYNKNDVMDYSNYNNLKEEIFLLKNIDANFGCICMSQENTPNKDDIDILYKNIFGDILENGIIIILNQYDNTLNIFLYGENYKHITNDDLSFILKTQQDNLQHKKYKDTIHNSTIYINEFSIDNGENIANIKSNYEIEQTRKNFHYVDNCDYCFFVYDKNNYFNESFLSDLMISIEKEIKDGNLGLIVINGELEFTNKEYLNTIYSYNFENIDENGMLLILDLSKNNLSVEMYGDFINKLSTKNIETTLKNQETYLLNEDYKNAIMNYYKEISNYYKYGNNYILFQKIYMFFALFFIALFINYNIAIRTSREKNIDTINIIDNISAGVKITNPKIEFSYERKY